MTDSYVCSGATMRCTMGTSQARLTVLPIRTVFLTGQPMANISDHLTMVNLAPFGRCRSLGFPATAAATAAAHGKLTPMPCMHNTPFPWMGGKLDYLIKGQPALLKSCKCQCMWGGTISVVTDGQVGEGVQYVQKKPKENYNNSPADFVELLPNTPPPTTPSAMNNQTSLLVENTSSNAGTMSASEFNPHDVAERHLKVLKAVYLVKEPNEILKDIPSSWKKAYNESVKRINEKYKTDGIASVYSDVEHIYNIYKLATSKSAKEYSFAKLSDKTPYQVFTIAKKIPGFLEKMPQKEFWETFDTFVPLYTDAAKGAYFKPLDDHSGYVYISMADEDNITRMTDSDWYKAGLLHHEYGHAQDHLRHWSSSKEFETVFNEFINEVAEKKVVKGNKVYYEVEYKLHELIKKYRDEHKYTKDVEEKLGGLSDCIQAAFYAKGIKHGGYPRGHFRKDKTGKEYFEDKRRRMAEFIAHSSENYWSENDLFKSLCPKTYEKMREVIKNSLDKNQ